MKIAVLGPQNTGKTTFIKDFIEKYSNYTTPVKTYRDAVVENELEINQKTNTESQRIIRDFMLNQFKNNEEENVIFDRCLIDNYVYTYLQYKNGLIEKSFLDETYNLMIDSLKYIDMFFYIPTSANVELVQDHVRDIDKVFIDKTNRAFLQILFDLCSSKQIKVVAAVAGSREERLELVKNII